MAWALRALWVRSLDENTFHKQRHLDDGEGSLQNNTIILILHDFKYLLDG